MGFFGSFNTIGKIYSHLRKIEPMLNELMVGQRAMYNRDYTNILASNILNELAEVRRIVESAGNTVKCADFQFMGSNKSIYQILAYTEMLVDMAKNRPF